MKCWGWGGWNGDEVRLWESWGGVEAARAAIQALTRLQNALLGTRLSDLHSGCRSYRVAALARIPFARNTDSYHFDTEVLLQLIASGRRLTEIAIPSYSGDELRGRRAIRYCRDVVASTLPFPVQPLGIPYDRKLALQLTVQQQADLVDYLKSL